MVSLGCTGSRLRVVGSSASSEACRLSHISDDRGRAYHEGTLGPFGASVSASIGLLSHEDLGPARRNRALGAWLSSAGQGGAAPIITYLEAWELARLYIVPKSNKKVGSLGKTSLYRTL